MPFIFIKTNRLGEGTERAVIYLKEYMSNYDTVRYGIVTDGNELIIINDDLEEVDDYSNVLGVCCKGTFY